MGSHWDTEVCGQPDPDPHPPPAPSSSAEQASDDVGPRASFGKTCDFFFPPVPHYTEMTTLQMSSAILGVTGSFPGAFSLREAGGKAQGGILLFICILVPKCKYNFLCYFFVVTTKMNILIR